MANWPYNTRRWHALRREKLWQSPTCEYCDPRVTLATAVDHRLAIRNGGPAWSWDNLVSTCAPCHNRKSRFVEQLRRAVPVKGCDPMTGLPLDPDHWWQRTQTNCSELKVRDRRGTFERN
jgi:hypothetical protein